MLHALITFWAGEEGGEALEWPLVVALVIIGLIALWAALGGAIGNILNKTVIELNNSVS